MNEQLTPQAQLAIDTYIDARKLSAREIVIEAIVLLTISVMMSFSFWIEFLYKADGSLLYLPTVIGNTPTSFFGSLFALAFPILFRQIFGVLPLMAVRRQISSRRTEFPVDVRDRAVQIGSIPLRDPTSVTSALETSFSLDAVSRLNPRDLLALYAERSSALTTKIYTRAGVYLMVGVIVAFTGLLFFYMRNRDLPIEHDYLDRFLSLLPGFGILFFIELVAFFFLRQYRAAMDEFRYFDAILRSREDSLVILKMFAEYASVTPTKDVLSVMNIYSSAGRLAKEETTDILESRRMQTDELLIFEKFIDAIGSIREPRERGRHAWFGRKSGRKGDAA